MRVVDVGVKYLLGLHEHFDQKTENGEEVIELRTYFRDLMDHKYTSVIPLVGPEYMFSFKHSEWDMVRDNAKDFFSKEYVEHVIEDIKDVMGIYKYDYGGKDTDSAIMKSLEFKIVLEYCSAMFMMDNYNNPFTKHLESIEREYAWFNHYDNKWTGYEKMIEKLEEKLETSNMQLKPSFGRMNEIMVDVRSNIKGEIVYSKLNM